MKSLQAQISNVQQRLGELEQKNDQGLISELDAEIAAEYLAGVMEELYDILHPDDDPDDGSQEVFEAELVWPDPVEEDSDEDDAELRFNLKRAARLPVTHWTNELDEECLVCFEQFSDSSLIRQLPCGHVFCDGCALEWFLTHDSCPKCRGKI